MHTYPLHRLRRSRLRALSTQWDRLFDRDTGHEYWFRTFHTTDESVTCFVLIRPGLGWQLLLENPPASIREAAQQHQCTVQNSQWLPSNIEELRFDEPPGSLEKGIETLQSIMGCP